MRNITLTRTLKTQKFQPYLRFLEKFQLLNCESTIVTNQISRTAIQAIGS